MKASAKLKVLRQNWIALFSKKAFMSCFLTTGADVSNLPMVRFILRSKIYFMMIVALTDFFKTLITQGYFFLLIILFAKVVFISSIAVSRIIEKVTIGKVKAEFSLTDSYLPNQIFLEIVYFFSFSIYLHNICLTGSFKKLWVDFCLLL